MSKVKQLPPRSKVKPADCWDLASLCKSDAAWETAFKKWEGEIAGYEKFAGHLGESAKTLAECLEFDIDFDRAGERLGTYAFLKTAEDTANSAYQRMIGRYRNVASRAGQAASYIRPEIMAIPDGDDEEVPGRQGTRAAPLVAGAAAALQAAHAGEDGRKAAGHAGRNGRGRQPGLSPTDRRRSEIRRGQERAGEQVELSNATFSPFLHSPKRAVRKAAFHQYYAQFAAHENTLAATLAGSIQRDVYYAKARNYESALAGALFPDNVPAQRLRQPDRRGAPAPAGAVSLLRPAAAQDEAARHPSLRHLRADPQRAGIAAHLGPGGQRQSSRRSSRWAASTAACSKRGLNGGWCDRYPNQGKQSGAFSAGSFDGDPYILMNYQPDVLDHVFTLAHEAGHSMHSYYSAKHQPFQYYNYTIFVAEVASTFNEQLLSRHLMAQGHAATRSGPS